MQAFRIGTVIIAANTSDEAADFYRYEIDACLPSSIADVDMQTLIHRPEGQPKNIKDIINDVMDERNSWLRMGIPCELHCPFIIAKEI